MCCDIADYKGPINLRTRSFDYGLSYKSCMLSSVSILSTFQIWFERLNLHFVWVFVVLVDMEVWMLQLQFVGCTLVSVRCTLVAVKIGRIWDVNWSASNLHVVQVDWFLDQEPSCVVMLFQWRDSLLDLLIIVTHWHANGSRSGAAKAEYVFKFHLIQKMELLHVVLSRMRMHGMTMIFSKVGHQQLATASALDQLQHYQIDFMRIGLKKWNIMKKKKKRNNIASTTYILQ